MKMGDVIQDYLTEGKSCVFVGKRTEDKTCVFVGKLNEYELCVCRQPY